jgi:hypothetical protein
MNRIRGLPVGHPLLCISDEESLSELDLSGSENIRATARVLLKCSAVQIAWATIKDRQRTGPNTCIVLDGAVIYPALVGEKGAVRLLCTLDLDVTLPCVIGGLRDNRTIHFKYEKARMTLPAAYAIISHIVQLSEKPACLVNTTPLWNSASPSDSTKLFKSKYPDASVPINTADAEYVMEIKPDDAGSSTRTVFFTIPPRNNPLFQKGDQLATLLSDRILRGIDPLLLHNTGLFEVGTGNPFEVYFSIEPVQVSSPTKRQKISADESSPDTNYHLQGKASPIPSGPRMSEPAFPRTAAQLLLADIATATSSDSAAAMDASERIWEVIRVISGATDTDAAIEGVSSSKGNVSVAPAIKSAIRPRVTQYLERVQYAINVAEKKRIAAEEQLKSL